MTANLQPKIWRLIPFMTASGAVQMALDRWLLNQHLLGLHPPTLRFYTWSPVAISLGHHQSKVPVAWRDLTWQGEAVELVRRPSGGRAVLHQGDLTYAIAASGFSNQRSQAYQEICQFLVEGWRSLSVPLQFGRAGRGYIHNPNCFGTATGADLVMANGAKIIGSAQLRQGTAILQHGSMRLDPDPALYRTVFGLELEPLAFPLHLNQGDKIERIIEALVHSACQCFGVELVEQPLSDAEWQMVLAEVEKHKLAAVKPVFS
ncbi:MAG: lipoate--protein ligase family protein [Oculatellaceae cyanobacterium Prado106]|nr:lipoate--protein ligase family protein [Oculatellaceae cyanobacterium Prado106]